MRMLFASIVVLFAAGIAAPAQAQSHGGRQVILYDNGFYSQGAFCYTPDHQRTDPRHCFGQRYGDQRMHGPRQRGGRDTLLGSVARGVRDGVYDGVRARVAREIINDDRPYYRARPTMMRRPPPRMMRRPPPQRYARHCRPGCPC